MHAEVSLVIFYHDECIFIPLFYVVYSYFIVTCPMYSDRQKHHIILIGSDMEQSVTELAFQFNSTSMFSFMGML